MLTRSGRSASRGTRYGMPGIADLPLGADDPLGHRRLGHEEGARDLRRREAAEQAQGQRDLRLARQRRVAAGEDEPQPVVAHGSLLSRARPAAREQQRLGLPCVPGGLPAQPVDGPATCGGDDPAGRAGRHTVSGPPLDGDGEGVLHGVLGEVDVAEGADEHRHRPPVLVTEDAGDVGARHRRIDRAESCHAHSVVGCCPGPPSSKGGSRPARPVAPAMRSAQPSTRS